MKVAIIYTAIFPPKNGPTASDRRVRDIARGLDDADCDVSIIVPFWHNSHKPNLDDQYFSIKYLGKTFGKIPFLNRIMFWILAPFYCKKAKIDRVILYTPTIDSLLSILFFKFFNIKVILEICDIISHNFQRTLKGFILSLGEKNIAKYCDLVLPISTKISSFIYQHAPKTKSEILPIVVDSDFFKYDKDKGEQFRAKNNIASDTLVISYVGGMYKSYGLDVLMKAINDIRKEVNTKILLVIGGKLDFNIEYTDVKKLVKELEIEDITMLLGWLNSEEVLGVLSGSDILVVPHLDIEFNRAGLPTKLGEYAAIGKATIATDVGDINKYFTHRQNIYFVEGSSVESLSNGLKEMMEDEKLRTDLGENMKMVCSKNFDFRTNGKRLKEFLENL